MAHISFVEKNNLTVLKSREELEKLLQLHKPLKGYDFSLIDLKDLDFSDFELEDVVFNYFDVGRKERKEIFNVNFKGCTMNRVSFAHCSFCRCNFDSYSEKLNHEEEEITEDPHPTNMSECDFFFCEFENCRFKNTKMSVVDFRYSSFTDCSMGCVKVQYGDFYMTAFHGTTNFLDSVFSLCSLTNATFDNHCLLMENIDRLIQEDYERYIKIFIRKKNWFKQNPCGNISKLKNANGKDGKLEVKIYISKEAKFIYTTLSGLYSGKGLFRDSNKAYSKAKKCEAQYYKLLQQKALQRKAYRSWLKNKFRRVVPVFIMRIGYGYNPWPVMALLMMVWFVEALPWNNSLAASICNSMGPYFGKIEKLDPVLESLETLLIGFLKVLSSVLAFLKTLLIFRVTSKTPCLN